MTPDEWRDQALGGLLTGTSDGVKAKLIAAGCEGPVAAEAVKAAASRLDELRAVARGNLGMGKTEAEAREALVVRGCSADLSASLAAEARARLDSLAAAEAAKAAQKEMAVKVGKGAAAGMGLLAVIAITVFIWLLTFGVVLAVISKFHLPSQLSVLGFVGSFSVAGGFWRAITGSKKRT